MPQKPPGAGASKPSEIPESVSERADSSDTGHSDSEHSHTGHSHTGHSEIERFDVPEEFSLAEQVEYVVEQAARGSLPRIVQAGHPVLRREAEPWQEQLSATGLNGLIEVMREVMLRAPGVGLAAPQIGLSLQLAVAEDNYIVDEAVAAQRRRQPLPFLVLLNPEYHPLSAHLGLRPTDFDSTQPEPEPETDAFFEGCLSVAGWQAVVERPRDVLLRYQDVLGASHSETFSGWQARIVQHETDHLRGTLYLDKAITRSLCQDEEYRLRWNAPGITDARSGLGF